jgi:hypothetical protein
MWTPHDDHLAAQARGRELWDTGRWWQEKVSRHDLGRENLVARIWAWKEQYEKRTPGQLRDLGASCDRDRTQGRAGAEVRGGDGARAALRLHGLRGRKAWDPLGVMSLFHAR